MAIEFLQQTSNWSIVGNWVGHRQDGLEPEVPCTIAGQNRSSIWTGSVGVLDVVEPFRICLPDIYLGPTDGIAVNVFDGTNNKQGLAICVLRDATTVVAVLGLVCVKGSEHGALSAVFWLGVIYRVDEKRKTEDIREQDEFLHAR